MTSLHPSIINQDSFSPYPWMHFQNDLFPSLFLFFSCINILPLIYWEFCIFLTLQILLSFNQVRILRHIKKHLLAKQQVFSTGLPRSIKNNPGYQKCNKKCSAFQGAMVYWQFQEDSGSRRKADQCYPFFFYPTPQKKLELKVTAYYLV